MRRDLRHGWPAALMQPSVASMRRRARRSGARHDAPLLIRRERFSPDRRERERSADRVVGIARDKVDPSCREYPFRDRDDVRGCIPRLESKRLMRVRGIAHLDVETTDLGLHLADLDAEVRDLDIEVVDLDVEVVGL